MNRLLCFLLLLTGCVSAQTSEPPPSFLAAEVPPPLPKDPSNPMSSVIWTLNYDLRQFDEVWRWVHEEVPAGPQRARALGAAALTGVAELGRKGLIGEGVAAFDEAIPSFPDDARLPLWRALLRFWQARDAKDATAIDAALAEIRGATAHYPAFTLFGLTLAAGGWEDAGPDLIAEANRAFDTVIADTTRMQLAAEGLDFSRSRRIWDSPIAPYNLPAMQAMIGDLALRANNLPLAGRGYFTALRTNNAYRWPWRAEVQRRLENLQTVASGLAARPASEYALGSHSAGDLGVPTEPTDTRFGGRLGNGSCTVCHTHLSSFDEGKPAAEVGWVRGRFQPIPGVPNAQPTALLLPDGVDPIPAGFGIGPFVDAAAGPGFDQRNELFDGTFLVPAPPGSWFVVLQTEANGQKYQGYSSRELGKQWFVEVRAGEVTDMSAFPIRLSPQ